MLLIILTEIVLPCVMIGANLFLIHHYRAMCADDSLARSWCRYYVVAAILFIVMSAITLCSSIYGLFFDFRNTRNAFYFVFILQLACGLLGSVMLMCGVYRLRIYLSRRKR